MYFKNCGNTELVHETIWYNEYEYRSLQGTVACVIVLTYARIHPTSLINFKI